MTAEIHSLDPVHIQQARIELAATFRWFARLDMHESIANHFSYSLAEDSPLFLINPCGRHFSNIKASELLLLNADDPSVMTGPNAPDPTAWAIHSAPHRNVPSARCVMHLHSRYATALACLEDPTMLPIEQNTMRYFNRVAVDNGFDGMGLGDEAERLATTLGDKSILLMGNHGVLATGETIAECFDNLYYFERAARTLMDVYASGKSPRVVSDEVAEKTAQQWENYAFDFARQHLDEVCQILDREEPSYRD